MTAFWVIAAILVCAALLLIIPPLFRHPATPARPRRQQNIDIAREQLDALESEAASGTLTTAEYDQRRAEIEQALYDDVAADRKKPASKEQPAATRWTAAALAISVPLLAAGLYLHLGDWQALSGSGLPSAGTASGPNGAEQAPSIEAMVERLAARLEQQPDDAQGWLMLGRSYMVMNRFLEAADAFGRAQELLGDNPTVLLLRAEAVAMANGGRFAGRAEELVQKALALSGDEPMGLWMAGLAAAQRDDARQALNYWQRLRPMMQQDTAALKQLTELIGQAEQRLGIASDRAAGAATKNDVQAAGNAPSTVAVNVRLAPEWVGRLPADATVFVYAQAEQGPRMPLAIVRKQARDLPLAVTLSDAMAMNPAMKLSKFSHVRITARVSRSGRATPEPGDLQGTADAVGVGRSQPVTVVIDKKIP
jgi:cytochrome c-type biogenesis protein CcmH